MVLCMMYSMNRMTEAVYAYGYAAMRIHQKG